MEKLKRHFNFPFKNKSRHNSTSSGGFSDPPLPSTPMMFPKLFPDRSLSVDQSTPVPSRSGMRSKDRRFLSKSASHATCCDKKRQSLSSSLCRDHPLTPIHILDGSPARPGHTHRLISTHSVPPSPLSGIDSAPVSPMSVSSNAPWNDPSFRQMSRRQRRTSLTELGFGRLDTYTKLEKLGEGTYATVYKGKSTLTQGIVALKEIRLEHEEGAPCTAIREISLLRNLKHANIVTLYDKVQTDRSLTLVFEFVERDLKQYLEECGNFMNMRNVQLLLFQLLRGLKYCHSKKILHRDLKPQNLLIGRTGDLKLADFGLARAKSVPTKTYSSEVVTLWYRPPEVLLGSVTYDSSIDMWGVGCIFCEMTSGRPLFPGSSVDEELILIWRILGTPNEDVWPGISRNKEFINGKFPEYPPEPLRHLAPRLDPAGLSLLYSFLLYNSSKRISACDALNHPYFYSLGTEVFQLPDTLSIFSLDDFELQRNPGQRPQSSSQAELSSHRRPNHCYSHSLSMDETF
ncbi:hypothetical protein LOD99_10144 [Oopsacas minuta]|uniref:cyclin-dependent kinase n=1 Tax=Oopsacas minuta TaxID=111878 RepID=A0AAV7KJ96_9METZ|nr:hypothetical protein LOD99_10144 [Oopsacas minuta]